MYAVKRPIENAHIARERDRHRFRELAAVLALGVPVGLFLLLFTWQNLEVIRQGRELSRLQQMEGDLRDRNRKLRIELESLTSLDTVASRASSLGLRPATSDQLVIVKDAGVAR